MILKVTCVNDYGVWEKGEVQNFYFPDDCFVIDVVSNSGNFSTLSIQIESE